MLLILLKGGGDNLEQDTTVRYGIVDLAIQLAIKRALKLDDIYRSGAHFDNMYNLPSITESMYSIPVFILEVTKI